MNKGLSKAARRGLPVLMLSGICSTSLQAQQTDNPAPAAGQASAPPVAAAKPASAPSSTLQEVVVTAQKVRQNLQKVSTSTAVVSGEEIQDRGLNRLDTVIEGTPGLVVQTQPRGYLVAVRGLGTDLSPGVGDGAVAINVDGAYNARPEGTQVMYDLARCAARSRRTTADPGRAAWSTSSATTRCFARKPRWDSSWARSTRAVRRG